MNFSKIAESFLELSSQQRLEIIFSLFDECLSLSQLVKKLDGTPSEVHRNLNRLVKTGLVTRTVDSNYALTVFGKTICQQIPSVFFVPNNIKFFEKHGFGDLPLKFINRLGELDKSAKITGFAVVLEKWIQIHQNSEKFIYNVLNEIIYSEELVNILLTKLESGVQIKSVISQDAAFPEKRFSVIKRFQKYIQEGSLSRRLATKTNVVVILNEREACVFFPTHDDKTDMSEAFYSDDPIFYEWCLDYFKHCWDNSQHFSESKLNGGK